ncbi:MAG: transporter substrate-binding domain-containing protein [Proteobacteria bacterium]|nr:transporter substrate-binding domain-containing protein [Pseudomonadota bacterium]
MDRRKLFGAGGAAGIVLAAGVVPDQAKAQDSMSVLDRIQRDKKVRITAEVDSPPFGILDSSGQPDGSEIATARQLAKDLGVDLEFVQVNATQRIPALLAGRADIAISSLSITTDRAKTIAFCSPHGALSIVVCGPKKTVITDAASMAGKRIALTRATLEEATVPKVAPKGTDIVFFDDIAATIQALLSGQVDAAGMSAFAAKSIADRNPGAAIENKFTVTTAYYSPVVRQADESLRHWIDTWVFVNSRNGVLAGIYEKYTGVALPPLPVI